MIRHAEKTYRSLGKVIATLILMAGTTAAWAQAEPTAMEQKFGVSDSTVLFILIGIAVMFAIIIITTLDAIKNLAKSKELWKGKNLSKLGVLALIASSLPLSMAASPYAEIETSPFVLDETTFWLLVIADLFLFFLAIYYIMMLRKVTAAIRGEVEVEEPTYVESGPNWAQNILRSLTDAVPVKEEKEVLTDHDYDGIQELDNNLPPWWKWMFYISIGWAVVYLIYFHVLQIGPLQEEEYKNNMAQAEQEVQAYLEAMALNVDENTVELVLDESRINSGKSTYMALCKQCHGAGGEGGVGPNLTDDYWIHGGRIKDVFKTVKYGVPQKGMISWEAQLSPVQIQNVSTFIMTLRGTNPPNPKAPQGELYTPTEEPVEPPAEGELEVPIETEELPEENPSETAESDQKSTELMSEVTK